MSEALEDTAVPLRKLTDQKSQTNWGRGPVVEIATKEFYFIRESYGPDGR